MNSFSLILGIESSCDETAAAVVTGDGKVLSNIVSSQVPLHARYGGVIPEIASRNHLLAIDSVVESALKTAGVRLSDLDAIAATQGPGLMGSLLVGLQHGKTLAMALNIPLVPVNHVEGHITAALLTDGADHPHGPLEVPYIALAVSGGHTSIYRVDRPGTYQLMAWTVDDAAGEAFDKVARILGLPYPGGVQIDRMAKQGNPAAVAFPRPMSGKADRNFSFSGLKTAVRLYMDKAAAPVRSRLAPETATMDETTAPSPPGLRSLGEAGSRVGSETATIEDIAASFQEAVVDTLLNKTFGCAQDAGIRDVVLSGGVAANSRLRGKATELAGELGLRVHLTHLRYCTDNASMIAGAGRFSPPLPPMDAARLDPFASGQFPGTRPCAPNGL